MSSPDRSTATSGLDDDTNRLIAAALRAASSGPSRAEPRLLDATGRRTTLWHLAQIVALLGIGASDALACEDSEHNATEMLVALRTLSRHIDRVGVREAATPKRLDLRVQGCVEALIAEQRRIDRADAAAAFVTAVEEWADTNGVRDASEA